MLKYLYLLFQLINSALKSKLVIWTFSDIFNTTLIQRNWFLENKMRGKDTFSGSLYCVPPGGAMEALRVLTAVFDREAAEADRVGWGSRTPAETHLDILHAQDVPTIIHVLLEIFVLYAGEREKEVRETTHLHSFCVLALNDRKGQK